jgi:hypothetical protein
MTAITTEVADAVKAVGAAFAKRRELAQRLADQDLYIGSVVRDARAKGHSWAEMSRAAEVSDVAILKAARRPEKV